VLELEKLEQLLTGLPMELLLDISLPIACWHLPIQIAQRGSCEQGFGSLVWELFR
jgi:hypothetical protein